MFSLNSHILPVGKVWDSAGVDRKVEKRISGRENRLYEARRLQLGQAQGQEEGLLFPLHTSLGHLKPAARWALGKGDAGVQGEKRARCGASQR